MRRAKLLLQADDGVSASTGEGRSGVLVVEVVRRGEAKFSPIRDAGANRGLRQIEPLSAPAPDLLESVFELQASAWNDYAGVRDLRTVGRDGT